MNSSLFILLMSLHYIVLVYGVNFNVEDTNTIMHAFELFFEKFLAVHVDLANKTQLEKTIARNKLETVEDYLEKIYNSVEDLDKYFNSDTIDCINKDDQLKQLFNDFKSVGEKAEKSGYNDFQNFILGLYMAPKRDTLAALKDEKKNVTVGCIKQCTITFFSEYGKILLYNFTFSDENELYYKGRNENRCNLMRNPEILTKNTEFIFTPKRSLNDEFIQQYDNDFQTNKMTLGKTYLEEKGISILEKFNQSYNLEKLTEFSNPVTKTVILMAIRSYKNCIAWKCKLEFEDIPLKDWLDAYIENYKIGVLEPKYTKCLFK